MKELKLTEIWLYPIKSLAGISLTSARIQEKGMQYDRRWMLLDSHGMFMTQRTFPMMALLQPVINDGIITIAKKHETKAGLSFSLASPPMGKRFRTKIWDDDVDVAEVSPEISAWFSDSLNLQCHLVTFPEANPRRVRNSDKHVSLADAYPYMVVGQRTLDDLNARLSIPLPMNRFRPNFVFTGGEPFEEDNWKAFKIGTAGFTTAGPCARCTITTIDQETIEAGREPLLTLATYRKTGNKILFGQNLIATTPGEVFVGDIITLEKK